MQPQKARSQWIRIQGPLPHRFDSATILASCPLVTKVKGAVGDHVPIPTLPSDLRLRVLSRCPCFDQKWKIGAVDIADPEDGLIAPNVPRSAVSFQKIRPAQILQRACHRSLCAVLRAEYWYPNRLSPLRPDKEELSGASARILNGVTPPLTSSMAKQFSPPS